MPKAIKLKIVWKNVLFWAFLHCCALIAILNFHWTHYIYHYIFALITSFGIPAGAHRLWSHRSYKAKKPLRVLLMVFQTICGQNDIITWARDHRCHHFYSDTNADPTNSKRGFFFSHIGWLMCKKHVDVIRLGKTINTSDLENDPILIFQRKYYYPMFFTLSIVIPMLFSIYVIKPNLSPFMAFCAICLRYLQSIHTTWLVNSVSHSGTSKPFDKNVAASDSKFFGTLTYGEGWHNFHHTFPWDYRVSHCELYRHNFGLAFIDFFAWIGWATNLRRASEKTIRQRISQSGDGSISFGILKIC